MRFSLAANIPIKTEVYRVEVLLFLIATVVCFRLMNDQRNERTWNWIAFYWTVLCVKNMMEVLHD